MTFPQSEENLQWYGRMVAAYNALLSEADKRALREWDFENIEAGNGLTTGDWPGWAPLIGPPPWKVAAN